MALGMPSVLILFGQDASYLISVVINFLYVHLLTSSMIGKKHLKASFILVIFFCC
jgi:hypothetical protein